MEMNLVHQSATDSVSKIFHEMSLGPELVDVDFAKNWLAKYMPDGKLSDDVKQFVYTNETSELKVDSSPQFHRLAETVEKRRSDLVGMLVLLRYTWNEANKIITMMINEFKCRDFKLKLTDNFYPCQRDARIIIYEAALLGRHIAELISTSYSPVIGSLKGDILLPFYILLCQILSPALSPQKLLVDVLPPSIEGKTDFYPVTKRLMSRPCPMVIWDDADIDSAVDCFCQSISEFQAKASWTVSSLFIQESVFKRTLSLLKFKLKCIQHGSRFDKKTLLEYEDSASGPEDSHHDLNVFRACDKSPVKLCIGWNPKDIDQEEKYSKSKGYIPVIPYRNLEDLKSLVNELNSGAWTNFPVSIWTEKVASIKVSSFNKFSTLWVNSHGLFHPSIPCLQYKEIGMYQVYKSSSPSSVESNHPDILSTTIKSFYWGDDFDMAVSKSIKAFQNWNKVKIQDKLPLLNKCYKQISSIDVNDNIRKACYIDELIKNYADSIVDNLASKAKVTMDREPLGTVVLDTTCNYGKEALLKMLVASLLFHGNSVVIISDNYYSLNNSAYFLQELCKIACPLGLLSFVTKDRLEIMATNFHIIRLRLLDHARLFKRNDGYLIGISSISKNIWYL